MSKDPRWNGEPCRAQRGTGIVLDSPEFPIFWARTEGLIGERVPVVNVEYGAQRFTLYDEASQGWNKLTVGEGSPRVHHANLQVSDFEELGPWVGES